MDPPSRRSSREIALQDAAARPFLPAAGFWLRSRAFSLDLLLALPPAVLVYAVGLRFLVSPRLAILAVGLLLWIALTACWAAFGATPGKLIFHLRIVDRSGRPIGRAQAVVRGGTYLLSFAGFGLGFVMIGLTAAKRGLHDRLAGTYVGRTEYF